jgi:hypothetical protein
MTRDNALRVIILTMISEFKNPPCMSDLLKRFNQTTIKIYNYELSRMLWQMNAEGLITVHYGLISPTQNG